MNKKFDVKMENGALSFGMDLNQDGEQSVGVKLYLTEAIQESLQRKESVEIEGAKIVSLKFEEGRMKLLIDSDKDGEPLTEIFIDLGESLDEGTSLFAAKAKK